LPRLIERFQREASKITDNPRMRRRTRVYMPENLYETLREIHRRSLAMAERLLEVMADGEHEFFMEYGRKSRKRMPDIEEIKKDLALYAGFLRGFDPVAERSPRKPGFVIMPAETALRMAHMLHYNNLVLSRIKEGLENTEYMKIFTEAKASGLIYSGKTALVEIMNLSVAAHIVGSKSMPEEEAMAPENWPVYAYRKRGEPPPPH